MRLDDREWKAFGFTDVFDIKKGFYNKKPDDEINGTIPFLGATANNNGVTAWYSMENIERSSKTGNLPNEPLERKIFVGGGIAITNNGSVGHAYYWPSHFTCSHDINPIYLKDGHVIDKDLAMFLITMIEKQAVCFEYARKWRPKRMVKSKIMLPVNSDGKPDYHFMREYAHELLSSKKKQYWRYVKKRLSMIGAVPNEKKIDWSALLDSHDWKPFPIGTIFNILSGKRLVAADSTPGNRPFIGALDNSNGVARFVSDNNMSLDKNVLGVNYNGNGMVIGFYHPYECIFSDDVKRFHLKDSEDNPFVLLFMKTVILMQKKKFGYLYKFNAKRMDHTSIMLPVNDAGNPDYEFMECYGRRIMIDKYRQYLSFCTSDKGHPNRSA